jgi:FtsH-binding integral membrane protein
MKMILNFKLYLFLLIDKIMDGLIYLTDINNNAMLKIIILLFIILVIMIFVNLFMQIDIYNNIYKF